MKKLIACLVLILSIFTISLFNVKAISYLDRIVKYEITIDPNKDGSLEMEFYIKWQVLNDDIEGPLEWIKIGIPNKYVSNIKALSSNIDDIFYYSDNGSYMRIDLDRRYKAGEVLDIRFSYTQSRMYHLYNNECYYDYKPGWFDEIPVSSATIKWNKSGVTYANNEIENNDYYIWTSPLNPGETITVDVKYDQTYFDNLDPDKQYSDAYMTTKDIIAIVLTISVIVIFITVLIISIVSQQDPYMRERGFVGRGYYYHPHRYYRAGYYSSGKKIEKPVSVNSSGFGGGGGGSSCACACACACAGGGRAGCSMKDFYKHPKVEQIKKALD